jgi:hypothetical protein
MKLVVRALAALAIVALATPAFACDGAKKTTTASAEAKGTTKEAVAKSEKKAAAETKAAKADTAQKAGTAAN